MAETKGLKTKLLAALLIIIAAFLITQVFVGRMDAKSKYGKVLVVGIDGLDPRIIGKLMGEGKLPNFKALSESGSFLKLNTSLPPHSPVAWTSIATGVNPGKHNIFDFIRVDKENYLPMLSLSKTASGVSGTDYESYIKSSPFWRITSENNIPTTVVRWPMTFPPESVGGNMLSGLGVPDLKGFLSGYTYYTSSADEKKPEAGSNKLMRVDVEEGVVHTRVYGPRIRRGGEVVEVPADLKVKVSEDGESAVLTVDGVEYNVEKGSWSGWIRAKFKLGLLKNAHGTFKAYLVDTKPFRMYVTSIQIDPEKPIIDISNPREYSGKLASEIGLYYTLGMPEETKGFIEGRFDENAMLSQINEIEAERDRMFWTEFEKFRKNGRLLAFVYDSSDRLQHVFWDDMVLAKKDDEVDVNPAVEEYLVKKDKFLGRILSEIDDKTLLLIVSDHGFTSFERAVSVNTWLVKNGFMALNKQITKDDDGALFKYVDWENTRAYSVGFNSLYVNVAGREAKGIVQDRDAVVDALVEKIENLTDEKTGLSVVNKAYRRENVYSGSQLENAPDIIIGFNPGYRMSWQNAVGGFTKQVISDNDKKWDGDHLIDPKFVPGILLSNAKISGETASQLDVAPTILDALGVKPPSEIDGKSLLA